MTHFPGEQHMRLLQALKHCEDRLRSWIGVSEANRQVFDENPAAALEAADLQLDRETMMEFENVLRGLARKFELPVPDRAA